MDARPSASSRSYLRRTIWEADTTIPLVSSDPFNLDGKLVIGDEEIVKCSGRSGPDLTGCARGLEGGSKAKKWLGGTSVDQIEWSMAEVVTEIPTPTSAMLGRLFVYREAGGDTYAFNVAAYQDGSLYIDWVNKSPDDPVADATPGTYHVAAQPLSPYLPYTTGVDVDGSGNVYATYTNGVSLGDPRQIQKFDFTGVQLWNTTFTGSPPYFNHIYIGPSKVWFSALGVPGGTYPTGGLYSMAFTGGTATQEALFGDAYGIAGNGTKLWVVVKNAGIIKKYTIGTPPTLDGNLFGPGTGNGQFNNPTGICMDPLGTYYYVLDAGNGRVQKFLQATDAWVATFTFGIGVVEGQISATAEGISVDNLSRIWIADTGNHRIQVFSSAGVLIDAYGSLGAATGEFNQPRQLNYDAALDFTYVSDYLNARIQKLNMVQVADPLTLGFSSYTWDEEFIGGGSTSGAIGERGWKFNGNGTIAEQASTTAHPGIQRTSTGGASGNSNRVSLGPWLLPQVERMDFIFAPGSNGTGSSLKQRVGLSPNGTAANTNPVDGIMVEVDDAISAGFMLVTRYSSSAASTTITSVPFVAGEFYLARFERTNVGEVVVTVIRLSNLAQQVVIKTSVPENVQLDAVFVNRTSNGTAKTLDCEYWSGTFSGLTRQ